jgi:uncharacterized protein YndB with AHSA1/START domain
MNSTTTNRSLEVTTPSDREILMKRTFDAPRALVFDAFTKPELIRRWLLGPDGWSMPTCEVDLRVGGTFHYVWRNDEDGKEFGINGTYREIAQPERIVHGEKFDEAWYPSEAIVTTAFDERNNTTTVTMRCLYESREGRDMALESGMDSGVAKSFDRLAGILIDAA